MRIGTMNHPGRDLLREIEWSAACGFDFIDLTLEPPEACPRRLDVPVIRRALENSGLGLVGHTAYYLPLCSPFEALRRAAVEELKLCLDTFCRLGARWMNLHPDRQAPFHGRQFIVEQNLRSIRELIPLSRDLGVGLMVENLPGDFNNAAQLADLLEPLPELGFHLDVGHANLRVKVDTTDELLKAHGQRLRHVHFHDNRGGTQDLHLPLGAGNIDLPGHLQALQQLGYDDTITLEVFTPDRNLLLYSKEYLRREWDALSKNGERRKEAA